MKKVLLLLASAALLIVGCNKELVQSSPEDAETVDVSFSAALDNTERLTRAVADNDGNAAKVNHWVMEVRDAHNDLFIRQEKDSDEGVLEQTFSFKLFKNQTYSIQFWADTKGAYVTEDLTAISTVGSAANVDSRDAFSANVEGYKSEKSEAKSIYLYRPFGQLNIITTDLADMKAQVVASAYAKYVPVDLKVVASIPTTFNVQTQEAGSATEQTLTAAASYADFLAGAAKTTLFMDYIFASKDENDIVNFAFSFLSDGNEIAYDFTSIPMRRNYRTNVMGQLLSNDSQWTVTIAPAWGGEINPEYVVEGSVAAAIKAIKEGKTVIEISSPADWATPIALPAEADCKDISINVTGVSDKELSFLPAEGAQGPANLYITTDVNAQDLVINCPKTHVELNGGAYETVTATTSANTLVVGKDVSVKSLDIKAGNVEIHGKVNALTRTNGVKAAMYASDRATLVNYINWAKTGDIAGLECDIDLADENWTPLFGGVQNFEATFDGQGYTISNLKVENYTGAYIGFISHVSGATIKNVTFKDATLTNAESSGGNARGAVIVGWSYACVIDNCHVINSSVTGCQKVAGILGSMSVEGATSLNKVTNCSVDGLTISCNIENDLFQSGALIGYIQLVNANPNGILIENNSVKDITFNDDCSDYGNTGYYNGTFIGTIVRKQQVDGQKIVLNNNTISGTNTEVFKTLYSSPYFGWTTNAENYSGAIAPIVIDGVEWEPSTTFEVSTVEGLKSAVKSFNAVTKTAAEYTIELATGTYEAADLVLWQNLTGKSLVIKAAEGADVTFKPVASGNKSPYIFLVAGGSSYDATRAISFNGIKFDYTQAANVESAPVYCCPQKDSYVSQIEGINPTNDTRYAHNITFNNCSLSVFSAETENISFIAGPSAGSPKDVAFYNCTMTNGGYIHSGYINGIICEGCTVSGVKALINSQGKDGDYTITIKNNTIQARHDYIVRTSGGKVIVENNNITSTYSGDEDGAGVVVVRNSATEATFTGNTFTKSSASMWDCYCGCACTVNGDAKTAGTGINF